MVNLNPGKRLRAYLNGQITTQKGRRGERKPSVLRFIVPATLASGEYTVVVRTKPGKEMREGVLGSTLQVA